MADSTNPKHGKHAPGNDKTSVLPAASDYDKKYAKSDAKEEAPVAAVNEVKIGGEKSTARKLLPLWIVLAVLVVLIGAAGFGIYYFQSHALPGVTLWGNSVMGMTEQEIESTISDKVSNSKIPVTYNGKTQNFTLSQLGATVAAKNTASDLFNAKRSSDWWEPTQYFPWVTSDISPEVDVDKVSSKPIDEAFNIETQDAVNATISANEDNSGLTINAATIGYGADTEKVIDSGIASLKTLGASEPETVNLSVGDVTPKITDDIASEAVTTLESMLGDKISIKIEDNQIYAFDAAGLAAVAKIVPDDSAELTSSEVQNGNCVFDASVIQNYWNDTIKPNFSSTREDRVVVTNNYGDEIKVETEGHDGVTVADGSDTKIGEELLSAFKSGQGSISVAGQADPAQTQTLCKHIVVDLTDHTVTCYENGEAIAVYGCGVGRGNDPYTGQYIYADESLATPVGDYTIEDKVEDDIMRGQLTLPDGTVEKWDAGHVGYSNYFHRSTGHSIHRITDYMTNDALLASTLNTSHGCVGIGWDVAPIFFAWADLGTSVHIQY